MAFIIKVAIPQHKYITNSKNQLEKTDEVIKPGGVVEDNSYAILGFTYNENLYDQNGKRKSGTINSR